jgi:hypothetical protein
MRLRQANLIGLAALVAGGLLATSPSAQQAQQSPERLAASREPFGETGQAIYPAYEGWGPSADGTSNLIVLGYMNRNKSQTLEIPIGPNNRIEPGGPDYGQPTVFLPGRQTTVFAIKVPKDFGANKLTWTLVANGQPAVVTFHLQRDYYLSFYKDEANGNAPPLIKFGPNDPMMSGPQAGIVQTLTGTVGQPVPLKLWASDPPPLEPNWESIVAGRTRNAARPPVPRDQVAIVNGQVIGGASGGRGGGRGTGEKADLTVVWTKLRGPGRITVTPPRVPLVTNSDGTKVVEASATATFSAPGEYVLRAEAIEAAGAGDGLCCFTFAPVKVVVK